MNRFTKNEVFILGQILGLTMAIAISMLHRITEHYGWLMLGPDNEPLMNDGFFIQLGMALLLAPMAGVLWSRYFYRHMQKKMQTQPH